MAPIVAEFRTQTVSLWGYLLIFGYTVLSVGGLAVGIALTDDPLRTWLAYLLATLPIGGFMALSWLLREEVFFRISTTGLERRVRPATRLSLIRPCSDTWRWKDVEDYLVDDDRVLGRFGLLEVGLRVPPGTLRVSPLNRQELPAYHRFLTAFRQHVAELNADKTDRAVSVATIRARTSLFQSRWAKLLAVGVALVGAGLLVVTLVLPAVGEHRWQWVYVALLVCAAAAYTVRRVFFSSRGGVGA